MKTRRSMTIAVLALASFRLANTEPSCLTG